MRAVDHVAERFPDRGATVRRLYLSNELFRAVCEDFALSLASLQCFEARPDAPVRPEIDDYRTLLRELEDELNEYLIAADGADPSR
jgi:hypothetical protein